MALLRVLIVDDYEPFLQVLRSMLPSDRFQVIAQASDGLEAVKQARLLQPDLMLLDVGLPRLNGIEVARTVKSVAPQVVILMLSQDASPDIVGEALKAGALGYIHKQRAQRELLTGIESVMAGKQFASKGMLDHHTDESGAVSHAAHVHRAFYYSDESDLLDGFATFIGSALRADHPVLSIVTQSHRDGLIRRLRRTGVDVDGAMSREHCLWLNADEHVDEAYIAAAVQGLADAAAKTSSPRPLRVAVCGELAGRLCAEGKTQEALALELFGDRLARRFDLDVLCAYPASQSQSLEEQCASLIHSIVHAA